MNNNTNKVSNPMKVITGPDTRWSYANVWEAKSINGGTPKFSVSLIIPKSDTKTVAKVKAAIEAAYNDLMGNRSTVLADCELIRQTLCDTTALDAEMQQEQDEMAVVSELMQAHIKKNASVAQSQEAYALESERIEKRYNAAFEHYTALETEKEKRMRKSKEIKTFITTLKKQPLAINEWNERLWITLLDIAIVQRDGSIVFRFKSGKEILA